MSASGGTYRGRFEKALALRKEKGIRAVLRRGFVILGYRSLTLLEASLDPPPPLLEVPAEVRLDFLRLDQLDEFAAFRPEVGREEALRRFDNGSRCFVAWWGPAIVWAVWIGADGAHFDTFRFRLALAPDEVYGYDVYTAPAYRGLGISSSASRQLKHLLAAEGSRRYLGSVLGDNELGIRNARRSGNTPFARVVALKLGRLPTIRLTRAPRGRSARGRGG